jgi:hypothetical protein
MDRNRRFRFVFVSPNGQETKYHFTINNLPSNVINDIDINSFDWRSFIATAKE